MYDPTAAACPRCHAAPGAPCVRGPLSGDRAARVAANCLALLKVSRPVKVDPEVSGDCPVGGCEHDAHCYSVDGFDGYVDACGRHARGALVDALTSALDDALAYDTDEADALRETDSLRDPEYFDL